MEQLLWFSCSVMSNSLWPHGLQHARIPCPSPSSGACSNSCPLSWWCYPTILYSVIPFSSCLQSFQASWTGSKLGKEYIKAVYCHPAYLTSMQNALWEMPGWIKHKLQSRLPISNLRYAAEKAMAPHSSTLAWKTHGQGSLVGCSPWGC